MHIRGYILEISLSNIQCIAEFSIRSSLNTCISTHSGNKPYKCVECDAAFAVRQNLNAHMGRHTGEKPFKCAQFNAVFTKKVI